MRNIPKLHILLRILNLEHFHADFILMQSRRITKFPQNEYRVILRRFDYSVFDVGVDRRLFRGHPSSAHVYACGS